MRWVLGAAVLVLVLGCGEDPPDAPACLDPPRGPAAGWFADATAASGIDFAYATTGFQGGGLAVVDLDGDDRLDIVAGRRDGGARMFRNRGDLRFEPIADAGLPADQPVHAIGAADLDNDGDRDLILAGAGVARVLANRGDGRFDVAARLDDSGTTEHVLPVDLDGDGRLDLYFSNYDIRSAAAAEDRVYLGQGGLSFAAMTAGSTGRSWSATALDADADGDLDLYVANDTLLADFGTGEPPSAPFPVDLLLRNDGPGQLTDVAADVGLATPRSSMGGLLTDLDEDGALELYVSDFGPNKLFSFDGARFVDRAAELGVAAPWRQSAECAPGSTSEDCLFLSWGAALADFDLDGHDELLVVNGQTYDGNLPPVLLFARGGELDPEIPCVDGRGLVAADLDGDGDAEVVLAPANGPLSIYVNRTAPDPGSWLRVALRGTISNRDGLGAIVVARTASGRVLTRVVGAGGVVHTALPAEAAFGLGGDRVDAIEVRWPSGRRSVVTPSGDVVVITEE